MNTENDEVVVVTLLGENLRLHTDKNRVEDLKVAVANLKDKSAAILRGNPSLSALQVALLMALENERDLNASRSVNSPFLKMAQKKVRKTLSVLGKVKE